MSNLLHPHYGRELLGLQVIQQNPAGMGKTESKYNAQSRGGAWYFLTSVPRGPTGPGFPVAPGTPGLPEGPSEPFWPDGPPFPYIDMCVIRWRQSW